MSVSPVTEPLAETASHHSGTGRAGMDRRSPIGSSVATQWRLSALGLSLVIAGLAQRLLDDRTAFDLVLVCYPIAAVAFAWAAGPWFPARASGVEAQGQDADDHPGVEGACRSGQRAHLRPAAPAAGALRWATALGILSLVSLGDNRFTVLGAACWVLAMGCVLLATRGRRSTGTAARVACASLRHGHRFLVSWPLVALVVALCAGAVLRFWRLREIPADLGWDLPYNYADGERILQGEYLIFFPENYGREGMFFYLVAAVAHLAGGLSPYSIRVTSALVGLAAIPAVYLLARECADDETAAYASLLMAFNKWHVVLTRSGYRVSLMPLFCVLALYALARALRPLPQRLGRPRDWLLTGLVVGLGLWTYKAFTFFLPTAAVIVGLYSLSATVPQSAGLRERWGRWGQRPRALLAGLGLLFLAAVIAWVPMLRFVAGAPETYLARELLGAQLVNKSVEGAETSRWALYARNAVTSLLMFNFEGDGNSRFGVPFQRHLGYVSGILFVLGLAAALRDCAAIRRIARTLVAGIGGLLLPMTVSMLAGEKPNCFRSSGVIGPAVVLAALALTALRRGLWAGLKRMPHRLRLTVGEEAGRPRSSAPRAAGIALPMAMLPYVLCGGLLWMEAKETWRFYFYDFRRIAPDVANYSVALELARRIIAFEDGPAYIKPWPHWYDGRAVKEHVAAAGAEWACAAMGAEVLTLDPSEPPLAGYQGKMLVLFHPDDREALATLLAFFPQHAVLEDHDPEGRVPLLAFYGAR